VKKCSQSVICIAPSLLMPLVLQLYINHEYFQFAVNTFTVFFLRLSGMVRLDQQLFLRRILLCLTFVPILILNILCTCLIKWDITYNVTGIRTKCTVLKYVYIHIYVYSNLLLFWPLMQPSSGTQCTEKTN